MKRAFFSVEVKQLSILTLLFNIYEPILVIDDVHKCQTENVILKETFETIIENKLCRIYFIGWFNIFKKSIFFISCVFPHAETP